MGKKYIRTDGDKKLINNRLNKLIGQLNGIQKMVDNDRSYEDLIIQLTAADKAVISLSNFILEEHIRSSVRGKNIDDLDDLINIFKKFNK